MYNNRQLGCLGLLVGGGVGVGVVTSQGLASYKSRAVRSGQVLRLKGKGVARTDGTRGDEFVTLRIMLPERPDPELEKFVASWSGRNSRPKQSAES